MRLCGADHPASRHPIAAGSRSHRAPPHRADSSERKTAISAVPAVGSCVLRVGGATSKVKSRREKSPPAISFFARGEIIGTPGFTAFFPRFFRLSRQWAAIAPPSWAGLDAYVRESHHPAHHSRRRSEGESMVIDSATASFESRCPRCGGDLPRKKIRSRSFPSCRDA